MFPSKSTFGIFPFNFISVFTFGICPFISTFGIPALISIPGIFPSILGKLAFISAFGIFPPNETFGRFTFFPFKLISGVLTSISGDLMFISLSKFKFISGFFNSIFGPSIFGPFNFPSIFKSPLTFGASIFFLPRITPE